MACPDPHSCFDDAQPRTASLNLDLVADFEGKVLRGSVTLHLAWPGEGPLDLDTRGLVIHRVTGGHGQDLPFELHPEESILGSRLRITLPADTAAVTVAYETVPESSALQWLEPVQTEGKVRPFLFSQCQAIHARAMVPCQDSPGARVSYTGEITVPGDLSAVMSAGPAGDVVNADGTRTFRFAMPQPIPPYLLALAIGRLESRELSPRSRVWAEPETVGQAAWEFAEVEGIIQKAEALFGPYEWERFDLLVLPPSFPYGGMENPRMTFLTPTLLAGDRSLVDVVAHELAHSWTGNLVTNATAEHFWLNEGWTVWAERKILAALHGEEAARLGWALGQKALEDSLERFKAQPQLTLLRTRLKGVDPDDAFSSIPYEKGARLIASLERAAGPEAWRAFVRDYMAQWRFQALTTEQFCAFLEEKLPGLLRRVEADTWFHMPGMPRDAPVFDSPALDGLIRHAKAWPERPAPGAWEGWSPARQLIYLQNLPRPLPAEDCDWLDRSFGLSAKGNHELLVEWLCIAAASDFEPAFPALRAVLTRVGRMKYLRPLFMALGATARTRALARSIFEEASPGYHGLSRRVVQGVLDAYAA
ncbi:MAG: M1 family metallopeptidase [Acidobacteria bacterium]|nr:M1 family metallopeptidase [Acidobacteriota bacterium]